MAPEQAENTHTAGAPADIYSLGCTLHFLLTGRPVYTGEHMMQRLLAHRDQPIPSLRAGNPEVPPQVDEIFARMIAKSPQERYSSMREVIAVLEDSQSSMYSDALPTPAGEDSEDTRFALFLKQLGNAPLATAVTQRPQTQTKATASPAEAATRIMSDQEVETDTQLTRKLTPSRASAGQASAPPLSRGWLWGGAAGAVLLGGILITITQKDGTQTKVRVPEGATVEITQETGDPPPPATAQLTDNETAEWILSVGGKATLIDWKGTTREVTQPPLPSGDWEVTGVDFRGSKQVTDNDLRHLTNRRRLRTVNLSGTTVTGTGLSHLQQVESLQTVLLDLSKLGEDSTGILAKLTDVILIDPAAERAAAEWVLSVGGQVVHLRDTEGRLVSLENGELPAGEWAIESLNLESVQQLTDDDLARLGHCRRLKSLVLTGTPLTGSGLRHLSSLTMLERLSLGSLGGGTALTDDRLAPLAGFKRIVRLRLDNNRALTDTSLSYLSEMSNLEYLGIPTNPNLTDHGLEQLAGLHKLKELYVGGLDQVTDRGLEQLIGGNPDLEVIGVNSNSPIPTARTLAPLRQSPKMRHVALSGHQLTPEGLAVLQDLPRLESVLMDVPVTDDALARLTELPQVVSLKTSINRGGQHPPRGGYASLARHSTLRSLSLIGDPSGSPNDDDLLGFARIRTLERLTVQFDELLGERNYTADWIAKFREQRPDVHLHVDGQEFPATSKWAADAPPPAIAPFDAEQAKAHQEAWAKYLGIPVEYENSIGMKFRLIPPGEFLMGSTPEEIEAAMEWVGEDQARLERIQSEGPQHKVVLTQPIYVGVTEVMQAQYEQVMGTNPSKFSANGEGKDAVSKLEIGNHPVENVSWDDAAEFCATLSQLEQLKPFYLRFENAVTPLEGTGYRLPTEAEWEFACRSGTTTRFWSGNDNADLPRAGWYSNNNSEQRTHAVAELSANPFGLSDVHGNVCEWVQDGWDPTFYAKFTDAAAVDPSSPFSADSRRVFRGGNWSNSGIYCRSSNRTDTTPNNRSMNIGFRVALVAESVRASRP
jgi:formylglycine-generating enzyme required for sulfatase activity